MKRSELAGLIDHTLLAPEATAADVRTLVDEAAELGTFSVCVSPNMLPLSIQEGTALACVVGFPSGAHKSEVKAAEAACAVRDGVDEVDMVINLSWAKEGRWEDVEADIRSVRQAAPEVLLKVIIESAALTDEEIVRACQASENAGADYVKTSTGFHKAGGASVHAVELMRQTVGDRLGVKASGGIRDYETALAMVNAGASRLGLSASRAVLDGCEG